MSPNSRMSSAVTGGGCRRGSRRRGILRPVPLKPMRVLPTRRRSCPRCRRTIRRTQTRCSRCRSGCSSAPGACVHLAGERWRRAFEHLEQGLLDALAGNVAGDRRRSGWLRANLVDLVDVDDAPLCSGRRPSRRLAAEQQVLDIFADVSGFGEGVASPMAKGTSSMRANDLASKVLPVPVGPTISTFDFSSSGASDSSSSGRSGPPCRAEVKWAWTATAKV